jgi:hypothetical protein
MEASASVTIHPSRRYTLIYIVVSAAMAIMGLYLLLVVAPVKGPLGAIVGAAELLLFGSTTIMLSIQCAWPSHFGLRLDEEGFVVVMNLGSRSYTWANVDEFVLINTLAQHPAVAFKYRGKAVVRGLQWTRGISSRFDGTLPQNLPIRGQALLDLMERWKGSVRS